MPRLRTFRFAASAAVRFGSLFLLFIATLLRPSTVIAQDYVHIRLVAPEGLEDFALSPNGERIVYLVKTELEEERELNELFSIQVTGRHRVRLAQCTTSDRDQECGLTYQISPDGAQVAYVQWYRRKYATVEWESSLYSVPISGGQSTRLDQPASTQETRGLDWQISPDSQWVVYREVVEIDRGDGYYPVSMLYSVPITGGIPRSLNIGLDAEIYIDYDSYFVTPDSTHVVFKSVGNEGGLFIAPVGGGKTVSLACPTELPEIGQVSVTADSRYVVTRCSWRSHYELYSFPITGGARMRLSEPYELQAFPSEYLFGAVGGTVVYERWNDVRKRHVLASVPASGGALVELASGTDPFQILTLHALAQDGGYLLYSRNEDHGRVLYSTPTSRSAPERLMDLPAGWNWGLSFTPDGDQVILQRLHVPMAGGVSSEPGQSAPALAAVPVTGGAVVVLVKGENGVAEWQFSPDGEQILYTINGGNDPLFVVSVDGGAPSLISSSVNDFDMLPDGTRIVYSTWDTGLFVYMPGSSQYLPSLFSP